MLKIAVCDDEEFYREKLQKLLQEYMEDRNIVCQIDLYHSGLQLMQAGAAVREYNVIFLDVNMDEMDGIQTAKWIRTVSVEVFIVFVTAFISYSPEGYKVNAIRYLLKDERQFPIAFRECMETIFSKMQEIERQITLSFHEGAKSVRLADIVYIESNLHKCLFYIRKEDKTYQYSVYEKLDEIEQRVSKNYFCRIHKSYLVNMKYIERLIRYQVILTTDTTLNVAKPRYKEVEAQYLSYKGEL